jgi:hypothetical protein
VLLPLSMEAYGSTALRYWLDPTLDAAARTFARRSAIGSLVAGVLAQVSYHLMTAHHFTAAPSWIVTFVACVPVVAIGLGTALHFTVRRSDKAAHAEALKAYTEALRAVPAGPAAPPAPEPAAPAAPAAAGPSPAPRPDWGGLPAPSPLPALPASGPALRLADKPKAPRPAAVPPAGSGRPPLPQGGALAALLGDPAVSANQLHRDYDVSRPVAARLKKEFAAGEFTPEEASTDAA